MYIYSFSFFTFIKVYMIFYFQDSRDSIEEFFNKTICH